MIKHYFFLFCFAISILTCVACHKHNPEEYLNINVDEIITLEVESATLPADGASATALIATIPSNADTDNRTVTFTTTAGSFNGEKNESVVADSDGKAIAYLKSPSNLDDRKAIVKANVGDAQQQAIIQFVRAFPEKIVIDLTSFALKATPSEHIDVTAHLIRKIGIPTPGTFVKFSSFDSNGNSLGSFHTVQLSNNQGQASAKFSVGYTSYRGVVRIVASVSNNGIEIEGNAFVTIIDA